MGENSNLKILSTSRTESAHGGGAKDPENKLIGVLTSARVTDNSWNMFAHLLAIIQEEARKYGYKVAQVDFNFSFDVAFQVAQEFIREGRCRRDLSCDIQRMGLFQK